MLNLLTAERIKLSRSKKLMVVLGIFILLPIFQAINTKLNVENGKELNQVVDTVINGATGIMMIDKNALTIFLVLCSFVSFFIGEEFQNGTIRNALSLGRSRTHYYLTKFVIAGLVTLVGTIIMTALGMVSFSIIFGFGEVADINHYYLYSLKTFGTLYLLILANVSVYVMIGFLTKNSGVALIWSFLYTIATGFLPDIFRHTKHFQQVTDWFTETFLFYYNFATPAHIAKFPDMVMVSLITIVLSSTLGIISFKRTDIK
ncbi:ABC transporter permease [Salinibacillus xinjiangensis]|uniref:ABC transporter permease subunit n=1 Tax=Salinibacillus xinjiangensis TaxID=1229268 RepID=A0A6G1X4T6_9BACI|nr:ABC transporter permease [Salinibacillus xinjiangensis]MRG85890.1 ABC transporter permease subunit [Salinibacillus xinjiangensis]